MSSDWEKDPATKRQKEKLRFFKIKCSKEMTKGEASNLIKQLNDPEREEQYRDWLAEKDELEQEKFDQNERIEFLRDDIDWLELEHMKKPSKKMAAEVVAFLDGKNKNWESQDRSIFYATALKMYPELHKTNRQRSGSNKRKSNSGCITMVFILIVAYAILSALK